ncbi:MAG: lysylphosphatidylglycerol synthase transmembrane domain-containing protein [Pseudomonadota bacterium]
MKSLSFLTKRVLPLVLGLALLVLLLRGGANWTQFKEGLLDASLPHLLIAAALSAGTILVSTHRWRILMQVFGSKPGYGRLLRLILESTFFNLVIPGGFAGDIARTFSTRSDLHLPRAASAVLTDRLMGLLGFVALSFLSLLLLWTELRQSSLAFPTLVAGALFVAAMALIYSRRVNTVLNSVMGRVPILGRVSQSLTEALSHYRGNVMVLVRALGATIVAHSFQILSTWCIALSLGLGLSLVTVGLVVPIVALFASIPITHFGIGLREGGFVVLLGLFGTDPTSALLVSALFSLVAIILPALVGLGLLLLRMAGQVGLVRNAN